MRSLFLPLALLLSTFLSTQAQDRKGGIQGEKAPHLKVDQWMYLPNGMKAPTLKDLEGKVVYMYCYQSWCPGCHKSGFPTLKAVSEEFKDDEDVAFLVIHTVFEGFSSNTAGKWKGIAERYGLTDLPFAHSGSPEKRSAIMEGYKTRGTPWTVIIGKDGVVQYNAFHIKPESAVQLIKKLKE